MARPARFRQQPPDGRLVGVVLAPFAAASTVDVRSVVDIDDQDDGFVAKHAVENAPVAHPDAQH